MDYTDIKKWLKSHLSEEKYYHSLSTADNALKLADITGYNDKDKAYLAGLLHDCAKCLDKTEMFEIAKKLNFVTLEEFDMPKTLHAPVGVEIAKKEFNVSDKEILSAIRFHTVAHENMTDLEMIVFLADKIREEFGTKYFGQDAFEFVAQNGLKKATLKALQNGLDYLKTLNATPCSLTLAAVRWLEKYSLPLF